MTEKRNVFRKIGKFLAYAVALVVVTLTIAHFAWKYSGSNQWELYQDKDGLTIHTLKVPGATRLQFKVRSQIRAELDPIVALWTDTSTEGCRQFLTGCDSGKIFKPFDEKTLNYIQAYRVTVPGLSKKPFALALKMQLSRDPRTNAIQMDVTDMPELLPADDCCHHMGFVHNIWRITPIGNGMVVFEFHENDDPGIPYPLYNRFMKRNKSTLARKMERVFALPQYQHTKYAFLREPPAKTPSAAPAEIPATR